jgi:hypothetical protein
MEHRYIESDHTDHKHKGWFYDQTTASFYRWNDFIEVTRQHGTS